MSDKPALDINAREVLRFLEGNPDFLKDHPDLFKKLTAPDRYEDLSASSGVVDLQKVMVHHLQKESKRLTDDQQRLVQSTRQVLSLQKKVHAAVESLLAAPCFESFIHNLAREVPLHLEVDLVGVAIESEELGITGMRTSGIHLLPKGFIDDFMGPKTKLLFEQNIAGDPAFYGAGAGLVRSQALIRLQVSSRCPNAILLLGSRLKTDFKPSIGQEQLYTFLGSCVSHLLRTWLDLPPI